VFGVNITKQALDDVVKRNDTTLEYGVGYIASSRQDAYYMQGDSINAPVSVQALESEDRQPLKQQQQQSWYVKVQVTTASKSH